MSLESARDAILKNWGHDILLQRRTPSGREWTPYLERHTVRHMYPATRGLPTTMQEKPEGRVVTVDMIYYFHAEAKPREGDRIYELDERFDGRDKLTLGEINGYGQTTWLIDYALSMRGRNGNIVYYTTGVTREESN